MAPTSGDYLDLVYAVIDCVHLKEQQESARLVKEKLEELNSALFESHLKKQKNLAMTVIKLKYLKTKLENRAVTVDPTLKETWELLADKVNDQLIKIRNQKRIHARLQ